jgi:hypothetical protein
MRHQSVMQSQSEESYNGSEFRNTSLFPGSLLWYHGPSAAGSPCNAQTIQYTNQYASLYRSLYTYFLLYSPIYLLINTIVLGIYFVTESTV